MKIVVNLAMVSSLMLVTNCIGTFDVEGTQEEILPNIWLKTNLGDGYRWIIWSDDPKPNGGVLIVPYNIYELKFSDSMIFATVLEYNRYPEAPDTVYYKVDLSSYEKENYESIKISTSASTSQDL